MQASQPLTGAGWTELRPSRGWRSQLDVREIWQYRELALFLALRDLRPEPAARQALTRPIRCV